MLTRSFLVYLREAKLEENDITHDADFAYELTELIYRFVIRLPEAS